MFENAVKMVRCLVHKAPESAGPVEVRWIPLTEFELWKFMVHSQYHFTVAEETLFFYISRAEYARHEPVYSRLPHTEVNKITLYFFFKSDQVLVPVSRYFSAAEYAQIKPAFLQHFKAFEDRNHATKFLEEIVEETGLCLQGPKTDRPLKALSP
jgi:hypothetical protein